MKVQIDSLLTGSYNVKYADISRMIIGQRMNAHGSEKRT